MRPSLSYLILLPVVLILSCNNQRQAVNQEPQNREVDPRWEQVDAFAQKGLFASALSLTDSLLVEAHAKGDHRMEFRAVISRARFQQFTGVEPRTVIGELEERSRAATFPLNALLHSVVAEQFWNYYSDHQWEILERTATEGTPADFTTWSQPQFMLKVIAEYRASLVEEDSLKAYANNRLGDLLTFSVTSADGAIAEVERDALNKRPTLFDLLAHRALDVFRNTQTRLAEPASRFTLDQQQHFGLFEDFAYLRITHPDSTSWEWQALRLYQELERMHLADTAPDALVDATLARLMFVRERSEVADKDSLYLNALIRLEDRVRKDTCWGEVVLARARWHHEMSGKYQRLTEGGTDVPPYKWECKSALGLCDEVIARFPRSNAAQDAANLRAQLIDSELNLQVEEAVLPMQAFKSAISYRNVDKLWLRVVESPITDDHSRGYDGGTQERLLNGKRVKEWSVQLPDDGDMNLHLTEIAVDGLAPGHYGLIISDSSTFKPKQDNIAIVEFWSTRLGMAERIRGNEVELQVVDRTTGAPLIGIEAINRVYEGWYPQQKLLREERFTTDDAGKVRMRAIDRQVQRSWLLRQGKDEYITGQRHMWYSEEQADVAETRTFLFTDRAIYRPGQAVMFKGLITRKHGRRTEVVAGMKTTVDFFDVNGEKVDSLQVTSDAYGSFHGTFTAPQGALTGTMHLSTEHGTQQVQVEEYKRPTFEVVFDPIEGQPVLGSETMVSGTARSYAGVPLDGARVRWTVKRSAHMPWWCGTYYRGWLPWGTSTQVAQGEAVCDAQGKFQVKFLAEADDRFPRGAEPTFDFTVEAAATDISGETQSANTSLSLGYRSINIELGLGETLDRSKADSLLVRVVNLNGQRVDAPMDIRVFKTQAPPTPLRDRQWERPDRFVISREEHAMKFPQQVYSTDNDPLTWTRGEEVLQVFGFVPGTARLPFREARTWEVGSYVIEVVSKDQSGKEVKVSKHFTVFDPGVRNTGFVGEAFHAEQVANMSGTMSVEPGAKAQLLLSSALSEGHVLMEVERAGRIVVSRWFTLKETQQLVELPVLEDDRGGFTVHLLCMERGLVHSQVLFIDVPWSNKELKVEWMSFRDKLLPGSEEEWRLRITGNKGEKVAAQLLGAMYDASLDHFVPHAWDLSLWQSNYAQLGWQQQEPFGTAGGQPIYRDRPYPNGASRAYPVLNDFGFTYAYGRGRYAFRGAPMEQMEMRMDGEADVLTEGANTIPGHAVAVMDPLAKDKAEAKGNEASGAEQQPPTNGQQPIRSDFRETAFFFPDLLTDRDGSIVLRFKTPDALTRWKVMGLAHTKELQLAHFTRGTVTQKPLMIVPNLPRFLRAGDRITLTAKINVIEQGRAEGLASLDLFDPYTNASLNRSFGLQVKDKSFVAAIGESAVVEWNVVVPEGVDVCGMRITANSKGGPRGGIVASDGEERALPVLTDKVLVTESVPLWSNKTGTRIFNLPDLLTAGSSTTLKHRSLKLEYTPNPAWYAVQALPYLMEFPHECAEQTFSRYYANAIAAHIVEARPAIKKVFEQWKQYSSSPREKGSGVEGAFLSKLEKNPDLKNVLLAETPWVINARSERESKERIALLFDLQRMSKEETVALKKLRDMQLPNGAWPWWSGMRESRYITQHIVAGFGHLEALKAADLRPDGQTQQMIQRGVSWLDEDVDRTHREYLRNSKAEDRENYVPGAYEIHFLYARSFFPRWPIKGGAATAVDFYKARLKAAWLQNGLQEQAMAALALHRLGDPITAKAIMASLKERATQSDELGMYWKDFIGGWSWERFPTETHALMIEAFEEVAKDESSVNALRTYLLKLKQTTDWKTTKATSEACYALLLSGDEWLDDAQAPMIAVGDETVKGDEQEAGTGTIEQTWTAERIKPSMGTVTITGKADKPSWGALHWQYFERMDQVKPHESPFSIKKQVMLTQQGDDGPKLVPLEGRKLKAGDKLTIRIELRTDRYVDYVHMKDLRAAGLEPTETLSGYKYQGGLGFYQSIRDASTNFFFDRIAPGSYVFEYALRVSHAGEFSNGITTAMCMYAPEFSSHSEGLRFKVEGE